MVESLSPRSDSDQLLKTEMSHRSLRRSRPRSLLHVRRFSAPLPPRRLRTRKKKRKRRMKRRRKRKKMKRRKRRRKRRERCQCRCHR